MTERPDAYWQEFKATMRDLVERALDRIDRVTAERDEARRALAVAEAERERLAAKVRRLSAGPGAAAVLLCAEWPRLCADGRSWWGKAGRVEFEPGKPEMTVVAFLNAAVTFPPPSDDPAQPRSETEGYEPLAFTYRNWRSEVAERRAIPLSFRWGSTEWHPEPQWLMRALDVDKDGAEREFAVKDCAFLTPSQPPSAPLSGGEGAGVAEAARVLLADLDGPPKPLSSPWAGAFLTAAMAWADGRPGDTLTEPAVRGLRAALAALARRDAAGREG